MYQEEHFNNSEVIEYLRKSRSDDPALSVEEVLSRHEKILADYAIRNLGGIVTNVYREIASSETIDGRPEMLRLLKEIENPRIKAVLVVEVQRLSRGDLEDAGRLIKLFRYTNTRVITPTKTYNLNDEYDRDAFERELKRGNEYLEYFKKIQARGRLQSIMDGNYVGSIAPYGYNRICLKDGRKKYYTLTENPDEAPVVRQIFTWFIDGMGTTNIARKLDDMGITPRNSSHWSPASIKTILSNPHYIGKVVWDRRKTIKSVEDMEVQISRPRNKDYIMVDGKHKPLVSENIYNAAQLRIGRLTRKRSSSELSNPFAGLIKCACGRSMVIRDYQEGNKRSAKRLMCYDQAHCGHGSILYSMVYNEIIEAINGHVRYFEVKAKETHDEDNNEVEILTDRINALRKKEISLWDKYTEEAMPKAIFEELNKQVKIDIAKAENALQHAKVKPDRKTYINYIVTLKEVLNALNDDTVSPEFKNNLLKTVIHQIKITSDRPVRVKTKAEAEQLIKKGYTSGHAGWYAPPFNIEIEFIF